MAKKQNKKPKRLLNKRARFDYEIGQTIEAGMELTGPEVKSLRLGRASLVDSFVQIRDGQAVLLNLNIPTYDFADNREYDPSRTRRLLMHKSEIYALEQKASAANVSLLPLEIYSKRGRFKVLVGVGKGRKQHDKRQVLKNRDLDRETKRAMKHL